MQAKAGRMWEFSSVFAGGRPAIFAILAFLLEDTTVAVEETEYTPYYDFLRVLGRKVVLIPSNVDNRFRPGPAEQDVQPAPGTSRVMLVKSNPCHPHGVAPRGRELRDLLDGARVRLLAAATCDRRMAPRAPLGRLE